MIIEFEIDSTNNEQVSFLKNSRWSSSEIIRKFPNNKLFFSKNTLHYNNADKLLCRTVIFPEGTILSYEENSKKFNLQVKNAQKNNIKLQGGYTPSTELVHVVHNLCLLGNVVLRIIGDNTDLNNMEKIELNFEKFDKYFFISEDMEILFINK